MARPRENHLAIGAASICLMGLLACGDGGLGGEGGQSDASTCAAEDTRPECRVPPGCGDGELTSDEECDDGNEDPQDSCVDCRIAKCGDGVVFAFQEQCDDGNNVDGDGCSANCEYEDCGDGVKQAIEECEGAGSSECTTSCSTTGSAACIADTCTLAACTPPTEICNAIDDDCDTAIDTEACLVQINRFYNSGTINHLYKAGTDAPTGFVLESQSFYVYTTEVPGTVALYQKVSANGGNHLLTLYENEANQLGYTLESTLGYVVVAATDTGFDAAAKPQTNLCRYFNDNVIDHLVSLESDASVLLNTYGYTKESCFLIIWDYE